MDNLQDNFSQLYDKYVDKIYRFCFLKVNSQDIAEDITSAAFTRFWEALNKKKGNIDNCQAFLYQIARNLVVDHYREKGKAQFVPVEDLPIIDPGADLAQASFVNSDMANVRLALTKLNGDYQDVIIWHYLDELTISEIADTLRKSEGAVRVLLSRALASLREVMEN